jgi:hypothetical protein
MEATTVPDPAQEAVPVQDVPGESSERDSDGDDAPPLVYARDPAVFPADELEFGERQARAAEEGARHGARWPGEGFLTPPTPQGTPRTPWRRPPPPFPATPWSHPQRVKQQLHLRKVDQAMAQKVSPRP